MLSMEACADYYNNIRARGLLAGGLNSSQRKYTFNNSSARSGPASRVRDEKRQKLGPGLKSDKLLFTGLRIKPFDVTRSWRGFLFGLYTILNIIKQTHGSCNR